MSLFRMRPNKLKYLSNVRTLDEIHRSHMLEFEEKKKSIPSKKEHLTELISTLRNEEQKNTPNNIKLRISLKDEISSLKEEIRNIENNVEIKTYFSKTRDILFDYYDITAGPFYNVECKMDKPTTPVKEIVEHEEISEELIQLNKISQMKRKIKKPVKKRTLNTTPTTRQPIMNFFCSEPCVVNVKTDVNRATLQEKYLMLVDSNYACEHIKKNPINYCTQCGIEKILFQSEGAYICQNCGEVENIIVESDIPGHKEMANEKPKYPYKKINHLKEKLNQLQSKETAFISEHIFNTIRDELRKKRIAIENVTPPIIKEILKKYKMVDCYEHLQQIFCKITGNPPIAVSRDIEDTVIMMFNKMQESYKTHRPKNRSNFLNYSYVLNKIFKILNMEIHAKYFGLLKSKDKLREQDVIWYKICCDMGWRYYPSV